MCEREVIINVSGATDNNTCICTSQYRMYPLQNGKFHFNFFKWSYSLQLLIAGFLYLSVYTGAMYFWCLLMFGIYW